MNKVKKSYICPACGEKQTTANEWQIVSIAFEFNLKNGGSKEVDQTSGDHEDWTCPECGEELPPKICKEIETILGFQ